MGELHCLNCNKELPESSGLVLTDEREHTPVVMGAWCGGACMGDWLVKCALDAMVKGMVKPSSN